MLRITGKEPKPDKVATQGPAVIDLFKISQIYSEMEQKRAQSPEKELNIHLEQEDGAEDQEQNEDSKNVSNQNGQHPGA